MFKKIMLPTIIVLFVAANASSVPDGAGQYAFPFLLSTPVGAKQTALGGAWCGWAKGPESFFANAASPVLAKGKSAAAGFENYWGLFNSGYAVYNHPLSEDAAFSAVCVWFHMGNL
jgi:hypothetical protein